MRVSPSRINVKLGTAATAVTGDGVNVGGELLRVIDGSAAPATTASGVNTMVPITIVALGTLAMAVAGMAGMVYSPLA